MNVHTHSTTFAAPADRVFAFVSNIENLPKWAPGFCQDGRAFSLNERCDLVLFVVHEVFDFGALTADDLVEFDDGGFERGDHTSDGQSETIVERGGVGHQCADVHERVTDHGDRLVGAIEHARIARIFERELGLPARLLGQVSHVDAQP